MFNHTQRIPWVFTKAIENAKNAILRMYNYSIDLQEYSLTNYLDKNCGHLLKPFKLDTGISINALNLNDLNKSDLINLPDDFVNSKNLTGKLRGKAGVYCFIQNSNNNLVYIGSTINFKVRLSNHYHQSKHSDSKFYEFIRENGGFSAFSIYYCYIFNNHVLEYNKSKKSNLKIDYILKSITQFEARVFEQAFICYFKPKINHSVKVLFPFTNWENKNINIYQQKNSTPVIAFSEEGIKYEYPSIQNAQYKLGISNRSITRSCNCKNPYYLNSPILNKKIHFLINSLPVKEIVSNKHILEDIVGIDLTKVPEKKIVALLSDKKTIFAIFDTVVEARKALNFPDKYQLWKFVNKEYLLSSKELQISVFLVKNPSFTKNQKCKVINTVTGEIKIFNSISALSVFFNVSIGFLNKLSKNYWLRPGSAKKR
jgi:uncharacterized ubiquitin-like protein YukD